MECGWESPEQIAACIHFIKDWSQLIFDLAGLGSLALIGLLIWLFKRLRSDIARWEKELAHERELRKTADETARQATHRAEIAEKLAGRAVCDKEELQKILSSSAAEAQQSLVQMQTKLSETSAKLEGALDATGNGTTRFWSRPVGPRIENYEQRMASSIPILMFGNQKGGVGKSTLVANLAGAFAARGERVLCVDLDYQGSLSSLAQLQANRSDQEPESLVDWLFQDSLDWNWPTLSIRAINSHFRRIDCVPAYYDFEKIERQAEYAWALGLAPDDVRYRFARALLSAFAQESYDRILIDAPPRFTLGFVNGFCSSTHLFVPTVVDALSSSAVNAFARQFNELKPIANPRIAWAGIIGTMTFRNPNHHLQLPQNAQRFANDAERAAQARLGTREPLFLRNPVIVRDAKLAQGTDKGIAYLNESVVRPMFDALATLIEKKAPSRKTQR